MLFINIYDADNEDDDDNEYDDEEDKQKPFRYCIE